MEFFWTVATGAIVGLAIGLTGVGGGSLMTPALVSGFGVAPAIAVGTDLAFAAITKTVGVVAHRSSGAIHWPLARLMMLGSVPACLISLFAMHIVDQRSAGSSERWIRLALTISLLLTAVAVLLRQQLQIWLQSRRPNTQNKRLRLIATVFSSALIGVLVAWSSIGAGAIGCMVLALIHRELEPRDVAATDIAYAVPLTAIAAVGHAWNGHLNVELMCVLLLGSIPGILIGVRLNHTLNPRVTQILLASLLTLAAIKTISS
jgi:uncharacterized protein